MPRRVADQFADILAAARVKRIYGVVGDSLNGLTDAIRRQGRIEWVQGQDPLHRIPLLNGEPVMSDISDASISSDDDAEIRRQRLRFRCWHRGTQEIDLIFGTFADSSVSRLSSLQLDRLEALLDCDDTDLFDWVTDRSAPPPAHDHDVVRMLRSSRCHQKRV